MCLFSVRLCVCAYVCFIPATAPHLLRQEGRWQLSRVTWWRTGCHKWVVNISASCMRAQLWPGHVALMAKCKSHYQHSANTLRSAVYWEKLVSLKSIYFFRLTNFSHIKKVNNGWLVYLCLGHFLTIQRLRVELQLVGMHFEGGHTCYILTLYWYRSPAFAYISYSTSVLHEAMSTAQPMQFQSCYARLVKDV